MFDHYIVSSLVEEIRDQLLGLRVQKIWSVDQTTFLLRFKSTAFLYINLSPQKSHARILTSRYETQDLPQPFLLALRKTLEGAKFLSIDQVKEDRTLCLSFQGRTVTYDRVVYKLYLEFMGRHSNAIITEEDNTILYAYKATPFEAQTDHTVRPGRPYSPLTPRKESPQAIEASSDQIMDYNGFYRKLIRLLPQEVMDKNVGQIHQWISTSRDFHIYMDKDGDFKDFHQFYNPHERSLAYPDLSSMLGAYYDREENSNKHLHRHRRILNNRLDLVEDKIDKLQASLKQVGNKDQVKLWGELLLAYLHELPKRQEEVEVKNYYDDSMVKIPLDPKKTPLENSQLYYKKYEKLARSKPKILKQLDQAEKEKYSLEQLLYNLSQVEGPSELNELIQEMESLRLIQKRKRTSVRPSSPRVFNYQGYRFEVGKNNKQNDQIRKKVRNKNFVWFHTKDIPGSHVVLHEELDKVPQEILEFGAQLASFYSKAQGEQVTVDYTRLAQVHSPRGGAPGYVNYFDAKQIYTGARAEDILVYEEK